MRNPSAIVNFFPSQYVQHEMIVPHRPRSPAQLRTLMFGRMILPRPPCLSNPPPPTDTSQDRYRNVIEHSSAAVPALPLHLRSRRVNDVAPVFAITSAHGLARRLVGSQRRSGTKLDRSTHFAEFDGITICAGSRAFRRARQRSAGLPDECVATPRRAVASSSENTALVAPRLNARL